MLLPHSRQGNWSLSSHRWCQPEPGGGAMELRWGTWECLGNPVTLVLLLQVSVLQEPWRFPGIQACVNTGFHSGGGKDLCPAAFCQHHPVEKNKMGEDSFCLNIRETLSAVTWAQYSKHVELSRVPPYPKQRVLAPAFVPFVFS